LAHTEKIIQNPDKDALLTYIEKWIFDLNSEARINLYQ